MGGHVMRHHAACADDGPVADGHTRQDDHVAAYPHVVADADGVGILQACVAAGDVERMASSIDAYVRRNEYVVADGDVGSVEDDEVGVGKEVAADADVVAVVAIERRDDASAFAHVHDAAYQAVALVCAVGRQEVVLMQQAARLQHFLLQFGVVVGIVEQAFGRFLFFCFHQRKFVLEYFGVKLALIYGKTIILPAINLSVTRMERVLVVSNSNELVRMKPERIAYISSDGNYVTVVLHDRTEHVFAFNLLRMQKLVETQLAEEAACFIRIGKSLIINRNYIYKINLAKQELVLSDSRLDGAFRLSASREALRQLKELLEKEAGL